MTGNLIEDLIASETAHHARAGATAGADVRRRASRRRARNATLTGAGTLGAVGLVAWAGTQLVPGARGFVPASWAPAPNPYLADVGGDGEARVPLPTPPQPALPPFLSSDSTCPAFAPQPTSRQGHAVVTLDAVGIGVDTAYNLDLTSEGWQ